jgi:hypothetical protein
MRRKKRRKEGGRKEGRKSFYRQHLLFIKFVSQTSK